MDCELYKNPIILAFATGLILFLIMYFIKNNKINNKKDKKNKKENKYKYDFLKMDIIPIIIISVIVWFVARNYFSENNNDILDLNKFSNINDINDNNINIANDSFKNKLFDIADNIGKNITSNNNFNINTIDKIDQIPGINNILF